MPSSLQLDERPATEERKSPKVSEANGLSNIRNMGIAAHIIRQIEPSPGCRSQMQRAGAILSMNHSHGQMFTSSQRGTTTITYLKLDVVKQ